MFISMWAGGMPFNGNTIPSGKSLGGSETAAYYMAKELVKLGHKVTVFTSSQETGLFDGVYYEWHGAINENFPLGDRFSFVAQVPHDVCIIQRHPLAYTRFVNAKIKVLWMHDLALMRNADGVHRSMPFMDFIFGVSNWHADQICSVYDMTREHVIATSNGVDYDMFPSTRKREEREPMSLLYTARPERGLENLVKPGGIMEHLPECKLYVCGYDNTVPQMAGYYNYLWSRCAALPNVVNLGPLGKKELYERESKVMLHVYPTTFEDTSCIAAMEAQAAGTPFIASQWAALPETCREAGAVLLTLNTVMNGGSAAQFVVNEKLFVKTVRNILKSPAMWDDLHKKALAYKRPWSGVAQQWVDIFNKQFAANCSDPVRLAKHFEHMSDIVALDKLGLGKDILERNYKFYLTGDYEGHYKRYYQYEKDRGVVYGPEDLSGNNRFKAVSSILEKAHIEGIQPGQEIKRLRILDYGCAHGHYVMNLKKQFINSEFVGVDIEESNIETAKKWAADAGVQGVEFKQGTIFTMPDMNLGKFDIVMANEVLEHVPIPEQMVNLLKAYLKEDGVFIATVPYGPWEAIGYEQHKGWRAHIHHFERQDLVDIFKDQSEFHDMAIPHQGELGHFLVSFKNSSTPLGSIDYMRKSKQQAPQETLSVCIIAKNEENQIGACLDKLKGFADEIIVGIDNTATDNTRAICERYGAKCISIPSPLDVGFDEARNATIAEAHGDWILWIDADERIESLESIAPYFRHSPMGALAIAQHHLGVNPPGVQKTDYPARIFRNHRGVRFFGVVHEHPEVSLNEGIGKVVIAAQVAIGHYGYSTEAIRRERFKRNFPLMEKDRTKYPKRKLGTMLWVRDLAHIVRYEIETRGGITDAAAKAAMEGIRCWREMLQGAIKELSEGDAAVGSGTFRLMTDAVAYYSECVAALRQGGPGAIEMAMAVAASPYGGVKMPEQPIVGLFYDETDARAFSNFITAATIKPCANKYL